MAHIMKKYYDSLESRIGYRLVLGGARHFGFYSSSSAWPFSVNKALRAMEQKMVDALNLPQGSKVLDCGCGHGLVAIYLAQHGKYDVEGIDYVDHHVVNARKNIARAGVEKQVTVRVGDYGDLSRYADGEFDGLYTIETFVHAPDVEKALRGFFRVLRPGGVIVHNEYHHVAYDKAPKDMLATLRMVNEVTYMPAFEVFELGALEELLRKVGFVDVKSRDFSENIRPMAFLFWLLALIPVQIIYLLGLQRHFPNTVSGYAMYRGRDLWHYLQLEARKPSMAEQQASAGQRGD